MTICLWTEYIFAVMENVLRGYCEEWQKNWSDESGKAQKIQRVDGKHACHLNDASDSLVRTLNLADGDNYPNIQKLLETASVSQIGSTEAEYMLQVSED